MSITEEERKSILKYKDVVYYLTDNREITLNLRDVLKYVLYWKYLIGKYKSEIRVAGASIGVVSYKQLEQLSSDDMDDKSPKGILKLQSYMFMNDNNFASDDISLVKSYLESYSTFMNFLEYKNPIYLSVALLCLSKGIEREPEPEPEPESFLGPTTSVDYSEFREEVDSDDDRDSDDLGYSDIEDDEEISFGDAW